MMRTSSKSSAKLIFVVCLATFFVLLGIEPAYAYVDPGTGGLLYQVIVVFLAVLVSYLTIFKDLIRKLFKRPAGKQSDEEDQ